MGNVTTLLMILLLCGCMSKYSYEHQDDEGYTKATAQFKGKDVKTLNVELGEFKLDAGDVTTAENQLIDLLGNTQQLLLCAANPAFCVKPPQDQAE